MAEFMKKALLFLPVLSLLTKSQSIDPIILPGQETSLTVGENNKKHLSSTINPLEVRQMESTTMNVQTVPLSPYLTSSPYFSGIVQPQVERFRSENIPYIYENSPSYTYPIYPASSEQPIGPTTKHFVVVSFIGLLLLFAIIQNSLMASKQKEGLLDKLSRGKRDLIKSEGLQPISIEQEMILNDDEKLRCIQKTICLENQKLYKDLRIFGKVLAKYLTKSIKESLRDSPGWDRLVEDAGTAGLRGENCQILYRACNLPSFPYLRRNNTEREEE